MHKPHIPHQSPADIRYGDSALFVVVQQVCCGQMIQQWHTGTLLESEHENAALEHFRCPYPCASAEGVHIYTQRHDTNPT